MTVTERLLKDTESIWSEYHQHPFVQGIADGTLDKEKFKLLYDTGLSVSS